MTKTVLIVDDSKLARIVVGKAIAASQPEWKKVEASDAVEAAKLLGDGGIDLAILDFNMPGQNGLDLAQQIRAEYPDMPIALATANAQDEIISRARELDATFVSKPITEENLQGFLSGAALRLRRRG